MQLLDSLQKWQLITKSLLAECLLAECLLAESHHRKNLLAECHHLIENLRLINQLVLINICYMLYHVLLRINLRKCIILNVIIKHGVEKCIMVKRIIGVVKRIIGVVKRIMGKRGVEKNGTIIHINDINVALITDTDNKN